MLRLNDSASIKDRNLQVRKLVRSNLCFVGVHEPVNQNNLADLLPGDSSKESSKESSSGSSRPKTESYFKTKNKQKQTIQSSAAYLIGANSKSHGILDAVKYGVQCTLCTVLTRLFGA